MRRVLGATIGPCSSRTLFANSVKPSAAARLSAASKRTFSSTSQLAARTRRARPSVETEDFRALAKKQVDEVDRRGFEDFENVEEDTAGEQLDMLERNREDPEADWFVASNRQMDEDGLRKELQKIADELEAGQVDRTSDEADTPNQDKEFAHDETKGDFIPRWMRNMSLAERRAAGVQLNEDSEEFEAEDEVLGIKGRAPVSRASEYSDSALLDLLGRESASNVSVIDVRGKMDGVETVVVCEGASGRQLYRMASRCRSTFKYCFPVLPTLHGAKDKIRDPVTNKIQKGPAGTGADWLVLELGSTTVHFMLPEARKYYDIEGLWSKELTEIEEMVRDSERDEDAESTVDLEKRRMRRERFEKVAGKRGFNARTAGGRTRRSEGAYREYIRGSKVDFVE